MAPIQASEHRSASVNMSPIVILCAVDGSDPACRAAKVAADLANRCKGRVAFVSVAREAPLSDEVRSYLEGEGLKGQAQPLLRKDAENCLDIAVGIARDIGIGDVKRLVVIDDEAAGIVATAASTGASFIVLGNGGRRTVRDFFVGTTAQRLLGEAQQPVILVK